MRDVVVISDICDRTVKHFREDEKAEAIAFAKELAKREVAQLCNNDKCRYCKERDESGLSGVWVVLNKYNSDDEWAYGEDIGTIEFVSYQSLMVKGVGL